MGCCMLSWPTIVGYLAFRAVSIPAPRQTPRIPSRRDHITTRSRDAYYINPIRAITSPIGPTTQPVLLGFLSIQVVMLC